ncbi:MAG: helix-turn-helix domain-containing protein [Thermoguttaceae bacterium]|nr:helix-turn-helix domain-containing protein [Thermoguttaceae bacterium]
MSDLLTVSEAAQYLRVSKQSVYRWHKSGLLHGFAPKGTKRLLFRKEDIMRFLFRDGGQKTEVAKNGDQDVADFYAENSTRKDSKK